MDVIVQVAAKAGLHANQFMVDVVADAQGEVLMAGHDEPVLEEPRSVGKVLAAKAGRLELGDGQLQATVDVIVQVAADAGLQED